MMIMYKNNTDKRKKIYIVWNPFQRRAQSLAYSLDMDVHYFHYKWEEKGRIFKVLSYIFKFTSTLSVLFLRRPSYVVVQLAPTPLLYAVALYCFFTGNKYISDCHNTMIYDSHWVKWPFAKSLLNKSHILLVHNDDVKDEADKLRLKSQIMRDPLPVIAVPDNISEVAGLNIKQEDYFIVPCSMAEDEPVTELFEAASRIDTPVVFTWYANKLPADLRALAPDNIRFTGFLDESLFNALYANAAASVVLTTREGTQPSGASEAIALGVPLVVSDIKTTRRLYKDAPVYVDNSAQSIADGMKRVLQERVAFAEKISGLKDELLSDANVQIEKLREQLG